MPISVSDVSFHKSNNSAGGADNLGGTIGTGLTSQEVVQPLVVTGVYISQAYGNQLGMGQIAYNPITQMLSWRAPGSLDTDSVQIVSNGLKVISGANGSIIVNVTMANLPTTYKVEALAVTSPLGTVFDTVTAAMSLAGDIQYRCVYFRNNHPSITATDVRLYIHTAPAAPQLLAIGLAPEGPGDGTSTGIAQSIASAHTAPAGVAFTTPVSASTGIPLGTLAPGAAIGIWQRRTVPPMAYGQLIVQRAAIGVVLVS